jgi:hypothetical protein
MRTPLLRTTAAAPPSWSVHESTDRDSERVARIAEIMARGRKHTVKAALPGPEAQRVAHLRRMLDDLCHECELAVDRPERAHHLADAVRDLRTMIARAEVSNLGARK